MIKDLIFMLPYMVVFFIYLLLMLTTIGTFTVIVYFSSLKKFFDINEK
jgi:hypothetical protein